MPTLSHTLPTPPGAGTSLPPGIVRVIGFTVGGLALVALADVQPDLAVGLAVLVGVGVLISHGDQLAVLSNAFAFATGHAPQN